MPVEPFDHLPSSNYGFAIVLTVINNVGTSRVTGGACTAIALTVWPATEEGMEARDAVYDAFPVVPKRSKKRFEASIDRVGPQSSDLVETRRISAEVAELMLGCTLSEAVSAARAGAPVRNLSLAALREGLASAGAPFAT